MVLDLLTNLNIAEERNNLMQNCFIYFENNNCFLRKTNYGFIDKIKVLKEIINRGIYILL